MGRDYRWDEQGVDRRSNGYSIGLVHCLQQDDRVMARKETNQRERSNESHQELNPGIRKPSQPSHALPRDGF